MFRDRKLIKIIIAVAIAAIVIVAAFVIRAGKRVTYKNTEIVTDITLRGNSVFFPAENRLTVCSENGVKQLDATGNTVWEIPLEAKKPFAVSRGNYTAVTDIGQGEFYVVTDNGIPNTIGTGLPISKMDISKQGITAVLMDGEMNDTIRLYDTDGSTKVEIGTKTRTDGFPVDLTISDDGKKLATLYISFRDENIVGKISFYNTGGVGKNYSENIVGQKIYEDRLVYSIKFLGNNHVGIVYENGFCIYEMRQIPEIVIEKTYEEKIRDIELSESGAAVVTEKNGELTLELYNLSGKQIKKITELSEYDRLRYTGSEAMLVSGGSMTVYRKNGSLKYSGSTEGVIENVFPAGGNSYFIADPKIIRIIKLKK